MPLKSPTGYKNREGGGGERKIAECVIKNNNTHAGLAERFVEGREFKTFGTCHSDVAFCPSSSSLVIPPSRCVVVSVCIDSGRSAELSFQPPPTSSPPFSQWGGSELHAGPAIADIFVVKSLNPRAALSLWSLGVVLLCL